MPTTNAIFRLFTEHLGGTMSGDFKGSEGDIWYDPVNGDLRLANGSAGGTSLAAGNTVAYVLPVANTTLLGGIKPDGTTVAVAPNGTLTALSVNLGAVAQNIVPATTNTYSLGNSTVTWQSLYVSSNTVYFDNVPFSVLANGQIVVSGNVTYATSNAVNAAAASAYSNAVTDAYGAALALAANAYANSVAYTNQAVANSGGGSFTNGQSIVVNNATINSIDSPGNLTIVSAQAVTTPGSSLVVRAGNSASNTGGTTTLVGGLSTSGRGGTAAVTGGDGAIGGIAQVTGGFGSGAGGGGNVIIDGGTGSIAPGNVTIGANNANTIVIGRASGVDVQLVGNVSINGSNTFGGGGFTNGQSISVANLVVNGNIFGTEENEGLTIQASVGNGIGDVSISAGANSGRVTIYGGSGSEGAGNTAVGGDLYIAAGSGQGGANGGKLFIDGGGSTLGDGGNTYIRGGLSSGPGIGGSVIIEGGDTWDGSGGNLFLRGGYGNNGINGGVVIGDDNTSAVTIGSGGNNIVLNGLVTTPFNQTSNLTIQPAPSDGDSSYYGGDLSLLGGTSFTDRGIPGPAGSRGGTIYIQAGDASFFEGGNVYIRSGGGNTAFYPESTAPGYIHIDTSERGAVNGNGAILIGESRADSVGIGHSNATHKSQTILYGQVDLGITNTDVVTIGTNGINVALWGNVSINGSNTFGGNGNFTNGQSISVDTITVNTAVTANAVLTLVSASATGVPASNVDIVGGQSDIDKGGTINILGGRSSFSGFGGDINIKGGVAPSPGGTATRGGDVFMQGGVGSENNLTNANGNIYIGTENTDNVTLGRAGGAVALVGNVTINGTVPAAGLANGANVNFNQLTVDTGAVNTSLTINNDRNLQFKTVNSSAYAGMRQQSDDNFVFYSTNSTSGSRPIWAVYANSDNSAFNVVAPLSVATINGANAVNYNTIANATSRGLVSVDNVTIVADANGKISAVGTGGNGGFVNGQSISVQQLTVNGGITTPTDRSLNINPAVGTTVGQPITINGGEANYLTSSNGGVAWFRGGSGYYSGQGGEARVFGGPGAGPGAARGGQVYIYGGESWDGGTGGDVHIHGGIGNNSGTSGNVYLGDESTSLVQIGGNGTSISINSSINLLSSITYSGDPAVLLGELVVVDPGRSAVFGATGISNFTIGGPRNGNLLLYGGDDTDGTQSGNVSIIGGAGQVGAVDGGSVNIRGGSTVNASAFSGNVTIGTTTTRAVTIGAANVDVALVGNVTINGSVPGGNGGFTNGQAISVSSISVVNALVLEAFAPITSAQNYDLNIQPTVGTSSGTNLNMYAGDAATGTNGSGGLTQIAGGYGRGTGIGGPVTIYGGGSENSNAGTVTISGGQSQNATNSFGGDVLIEGGFSDNNALLGSISVGEQFTKAVRIGNSGVNVALTGNVTINGTVPAAGIANGANVNFNQETIDTATVNTALIVGNGATSVLTINTIPALGISYITAQNSLFFGSSNGIVSLESSQDMTIRAYGGGIDIGVEQNGLSNPGSDVSIYGGAANSNTAGGVVITGGQSTVSGNGGSIAIVGGESWGATGGDVTIVGGRANSGAHGVIHIGETNTTEVHIGNTSANVVLVGNVTINGSVPGGGVANGANVNFNQLTVSALTSNVSITGPNSFFTANVNTILLGGMTVNSIPGIGTFVTNQPNEGIYFSAVGNGGIIFAGNGGGFEVTGDGPILMQPYNTIELHPADALNLGEKGHPVNIYGGASRNGVGGDVLIDAGISTALSPLAGDVYIGADANQTSNVVIGTNGINVSLVGNVTINGSNTFGGGGFTNGQSISVANLVVNDSITMAAGANITSVVDSNLTLQPLMATNDGSTLSLFGGKASANGTGGAVQILGGDGSGSGNGGPIAISAGYNYGANAAGYVAITGGQSLGSANGGEVYIFGGIGDTTTGGSVLIAGGIGFANAYGNVYVGAFNTNTVSIGTNGVNVALTGNVTINGAVPAAGIANGSSVNFSELVTGNTTVNNTLLIGNATFNATLLADEGEGLVYMTTDTAGLGLYTTNASAGFIEINSASSLDIYSGVGDIAIGVNGNGFGNPGWDVLIYGGSSNSNKAGGVKLQGGQSTATGNGGNIFIEGGNAWGANGGDVIIQGGLANNGNHGIVSIGQANTTQVLIGAPSVNTVIGVANSYGIKVSNNRVEITTDQANLGFIHIGYTPGAGSPNNTSNTIVYSDNLRVEETFNIPDFNAADLRAQTRSAGAMAAVRDNAGKIAYWNTSNSEWQYVSDNTPV